MYAEQKVNILLVDDRPENLLALTAILENLEQNLVTATSGEEALKYLLQMDFAVILLDVRMPGMNGFETAELIRNRQRNQNTPIIFLTAYSRSENLIFQGYSVGAVDYMLKPLIPEILISKVTVFIELFKKNLEIQQQAEQLSEANKILQRQIQEHQKTENLLRKREGEFAAIFRAIPDVIIFVNKDGVITIANPSIINTFGYQPEEIIGKKYQFLCHQTEIEAHCLCKNKCFHRKFKNHVGIYYKKNGEKFIGETINTFVDDPAGNIIGFLHIIRDITERNMIEKMKDEFLSVVSHELRTPLTSIYASLNLLSTGRLDAQSDKGKQVIQIAADGSERLISLVNDILDLERLTSGKIELVKQRCYANQLMLRSVENVQNMANNAGITLSVFYQEIELDVAGDRIIQVLINLLSNAIKFSHKGSLVELNVESLLDRNSVLFKVKDQGRGVPADRLECIFERFQQVDASDSRAKGGTGLGLAICRNIIREHNGKIWAESIEGQGSTFYFTVPRLTVEKSKNDN